MHKFYRIVGKVFFPRAQTWKQVRNARMMIFVVLFSIVLALAIAGLMKVMYNHTH